MGFRSSCQSAAPVWLSPLAVKLKWGGDVSISIPAMDTTNGSDGGWCLFPVVLNPVAHSPEAFRVTSNVTGRDAPAVNAIGVGRFNMNGGIVNSALPAMV